MTVALVANTVMEESLGEVVMAPDLQAATLVVVVQVVAELVGEKDQGIAVKVASLAAAPTVAAWVVAGMARQFADGLWSEQSLFCW